MPIAVEKKQRCEKMIKKIMMIVMILAMLSGVCAYKYRTRKRYAIVRTRR